MNEKEKKNDLPVDILMVTWNRPEITELSIRTLAKNTITPSRLIVVDNKSEDKMRDMLFAMTQESFISEIIFLDNNIGLEPARNIGLSSIKSKYFVCCDNDILPEKPVSNEDWLSRLINLMDKNPDYGAIACRTQVMIGTGNIFEEADKNPSIELVEFSHPGSSLRMMRTDLTKWLGGWRNEVRGRGQEEMYICGELRKQNYKTGFAKNIKCYHMFGKSNWGYSEELKPEEHGHSSGVWHPAIINGDDENEIRQYV